eukprot:TRINITY_DN12586_c0_g2_i1.p1 TRINITY_DN12586_c0_g2~~TRINITY_DN12586_c0_g2_i1.p1  ORF type:complete len:226 (-),score=31.28 TRINITY_DN12586_c0_g2_i1:165-803(-)
MAALDYTTVKNTFIDEYTETTASGMGRLKVCMSQPLLNHSYDAERSRLFGPTHCGCTSPGTLGHPELCNRPCEWVRTWSCSKGNDCFACHAVGHRGVIMLRKDDREFLRTLRLVTRMQLAIPILYQSAESCGMQSTVASFCKWLEDSVAGQSAPMQPNKYHKRFSQIFTRHSFSSLVRWALLSYNTRSDDDDLAKHVADKFEELRGSLGRAL